MKILIALAIVVVLIAGCSSQTDYPREEFFNFSVHFCFSEDCLHKIISDIDDNYGSQCALYRADKGISELPVELVVDRKAKVAAITGMSVYKAKSKGIMHNKYCVFRNNSVLTGSFNPVKEAKNDYNNLILINSTLLADFYSENFDNLAGFGNINRKVKTVVLNKTLVEVYFCPADKCADAVKRKIRNANSSIVFASFIFTHPGLANELILKSSEGIYVRGVIEKSTTGSKYSKHDVLARNGIDVVLEDSKALMHHKFFVIDNEMVITGSFNPTKNADTRNDENIIVIRNKGIAERYIEEFNNIWNN
jgi:phosphatidylserine/phosphatidylglycerophosphate/cardiolipin synthase-like enzyme